MNFRQNFSDVLGTELWIAVAVFAAVLVVLAAALVRRRARAGVEPSGKAKHPRLEAAYAAAVLGMAVFLVVQSVSANGAEFSSAARPALTVRVTAYQWCWRFDYPAAGVMVTGDCLHGDYPTLVLPTGRAIEVALTSDDVVHELWVPYLRFKREAFPDHVNRFPLVLDHTGSWRGTCSEFCGLYHDTMDMNLKAVTPAAFEAWLSSQGRRS